MKKTILAGTLLSLAFSFTTAQKKNSVKHVQVTAQTITRRPAGKAYAIDLTRKGTVYTLATNVDHSRVQVHTPKGEMTMADLLKKVDKRGKVRVGMTDDIRTLKLNLVRKSGGAVNFTCEGLLCTCTGDADCNDLFSSNLCGDIAVCDENGCACLRL